MVVIDDSRSSLYPHIKIRMDAILLNALGVGLGAKRRHSGGSWMKKRKDGAKRG